MAVDVTGFSATEPMRLGSTSWAGERVHRVTRTEYNYFSPCGVRLRSTWTAAPSEVHGRLCEKCFTSDERHAVYVANSPWLARS